MYANTVTNSDSLYTDRSKWGIVDPVYLIQTKLFIS